MGGSAVARCLIGLYQGVVTVIHHEGWTIAHDRICMNMSVSDHLVTATASDQFDNFEVNTGAE